MALEQDSQAKLENELEAVRTEIEEVRGLPGVSIGSLTTDDPAIYNNLLIQERALERKLAIIGSTSTSIKTRRSVSSGGSSY